jgi:hypothetical protein
MPYSPFIHDRDYHWNIGLNSPIVFDISGLPVRTYYCTTANACGIDTSGSFIIQTIQPPSRPTIQYDSLTTLCYGDSISLSTDSTSYSSYTWLLNGLIIPSSNSFHIPADTNGNYFVSANYACGNLISDTIALHFNSLPSLNLGSDTTICITQSITFDAGSGFNTYQWQDSSTTQFFTAFSPVADTMQLYATVTDSNSCSNTDTIQIVFDICAGINSSSEIRLQIYPNPTTSIFMIKNISPKEKALIEITNAFGEIVYSEEMFGNREYLINAHLAKGIYFVKVKDVVKKLIVD